MLNINISQSWEFSLKKLENILKIAVNYLIKQIKLTSQF